LGDLPGAIGTREEKGGVDRGESGGKGHVLLKEVLARGEKAVEGVVRLGQSRDASVEPGGIGEHRGLLGEERKKVPLGTMLELCGVRELARQGALEGETHSGEKRE
jgi:hypothetical protein